MWTKGIFGAIVLGLIVAIELTIGWGRMLEPWSRAAPGAIFGAAFLVVLTYVIRSARLYRFYRDCNDMSACLRLFLLHNVFVNFLPLHSGDVSFPVLMKRYFGISLNHSVSGLLWLRYLDFHTLVLIALAALWATSSWGWVPLLFFAWILVPIVMVLFWEVCGRVLARHDNRISKLVGDMMTTLPKSRRKLFESWAWTTLNWGVKLFSFAWILTLFTPVDFLDSVFGAAGGELSMVLPVTGPAGIGTYEAGVIAAMTPLGVGLHFAIIGAVNLHLFVLGMAVVGGLITFLLPRPRVKKLSRVTAV